MGRVSARSHVVTCWRTMLMAGCLTAVMSDPAEAICWITAEHPLTADNLPMGRSEVTGMRKAGQVINDILHRNPVLPTLPGVRLRTRMQIGVRRTGLPRSHYIFMRGHRREVWVGECGVLDGADRLEPRRPWS